MNIPNHPQPHVANQIQEKETQEKEALALFFNRYVNKNDQIFVQKTQMSGREAYLGAVTLEWFANHVTFASRLPLFHHKINPENDRVEIDTETIDQIQQRPLDWSRQAPLAQYLAVKKYHKFPPVLVVIDRPWVNNPHGAEWDEEGRATKSTIDFIPVDGEGKVGILDLAQDIRIFALDGQHRLMGVQGLMELITTGKLQRYKKDKQALGSFLTIEDISQTYNIDPLYFQNLAQEEIGIEFIAAVVAGETRQEARQRVRSIFVHVNLMAVPLTKGQLAQLDEDDGFSIVARKIAVTHPLLQDRQYRHSRVNWNSATVAAKSTVFTTLQALKDMSQGYLSHKFPNWKSSDRKNLIPLRPEDEELAEGIAKFNQLFDYLANLPSYQRMEEGIETPKLRRFSFEKNGGEGNMLFRPIGQIALVQALGILVFRKQFYWEDIFKKLRQYDLDGGFSGMEYPQSIWYGILYDPHQRKVLVSGKDLASRLLIYLMGGIEDDFERAELRRAVAINRHVGSGQCMGFEGKFVKPREVGLPEVLEEI